jgi:hypothetical protein
LKRCIEGKVEQLLEAQVGDVAVTLARDQHRALVVARDGGAQQVELALVADAARDSGLPEQFLGLGEGGVGDGDEAIREHGVEVGLRDVERELGALRAEIDFRGALSGFGCRREGSDAAARVDRLCNRKSERVLVLRAEADLAEVDALRRGAGGRLIERCLTLRGGGGGGNLWCADGLGLRCRIRRRAAGEGGELRLQRAGVGEARVDLWVVRAARLLHLAGGAGDARAGDLERLALARGEADRLVEREGRARGGIGRHLLRTDDNGGRDREQQCERVNAATACPGPSDVHCGGGSEERLGHAMRAFDLVRTAVVAVFFTPIILRKHCV